MGTNDASDVRLQLYANGYLPVPNLDKRCALKGWASSAFAAGLTPEQIKGWSKEHRGFKATGILVRGGLLAIDLDILDDSMVDAMINAVAAIAPRVFESAPFRSGRPPKLMILARWQASTAYPDMFTRIASDKFFDEAGAGHQVEIFGGALSRTGSTSKQIGAFGPHSYEEDDTGKINFRKVIHSYAWWDADDQPTPLTVPLHELPTITQEQCWALLKAFEEAATARGWRRKVADSRAAGQFQYDITEASRFQVQGGEDNATYHDLDAGMRVSGSFIDGSTSRRDKCLVSFCDARQCLGVWDTEGGAWHLPADARPRTVEESAEALREGLAKLQAARVPTTSSDAPDKPKATDSIADQVYWLLQTHAYCPRNHTVVDLFKPDAACELKTQAFQHEYLSWRHESVGPRGGKIVDLASNAWLVSADRPTVEGVRMRPDRDFPLYQEGGAWFKNTYLKPAHQGAGAVQQFLDFMLHLLPVAEEREWFLDWVAHKYRFPDIPGVAIIMVAAGEHGAVYGAGRGMLRDILAKLMGERYVRPIDFDIFSGRSGQAIYTDWAAYATLVTVSESKDTPDAGRYTAQRAVYERLKEIVDPRPVERTFIAKGQPAFRSLAFASYMVFSNNRDALQIPEDDRRVAALRNGVKLPGEQAAALQLWMDQPGNIAALARYLDARDITGFNAYAPLHTKTKGTMQELARSELDHAYDMVKRRIGSQRLFTGEQVRAAVMHEMGDPMMPSENIKNQLLRKLRNDATQVLDYRLTHTLGRHKILAWRDSVGAATGEKMSREDAQVAAANTNIILADPTSVVIHLPVAGSGTGEKDEGEQPVE